MAEPESTYDLMMNPRACRGFQWVGQSFAHCENCGQPYWDRTHEERLGPGGPFGNSWRLVVIPRELARRVERNWG